jgi:AAA family ATP:ADP antiporter
MFITILLVIAAYTTTKAVRDAVFLTRFGLRELSYVMIGVAVAAGFLVSLFTRWTAGVRRDRLMFATNSCIAVTLVALALGLRAGWPYLTWVLYCWSAVFGLVLVAEFWLLGNDLFNAREAKRLFPIIGAGAILGGVVGGAIPGWLARTLGSANLLYLVAGELVLASVTAHMASRLRPPEARAEAASRRVPPRFAEGLALLHKNGYLRLIAMMMVCMTVSMTLVQWQYKGISKSFFGDRRDDMTAFFGTLAALLNVASFLLQLIGTPRILKRFGIGVGLRVLPGGFAAGACLLLGSTLVPVTPLWAAAAAALLSDGLRFSVDKASTELLYVPIPRGIKDQAKPFIDTVVDRFAGAAAGFLWLFLDWGFHVDRPERIPWASLATLILVGGWLLVISRAKKDYVDAYRRMLAAPASEPEGLTREGTECLSAVRAALHLPPAERTRILRAVGRLLRSDRPLRLPVQAVEPLLLLEARTLVELASALRAEGVFPTSEARARRAALLPRTLEEKLHATVERIGRALALCHPPRDMTAAWRALRGGSRVARAGALELLDNMLDGPAREELLRALDQVALEGGNLPRADREESRRALMDGDDPWLRVCAAWKPAPEELELRC